MSQHEKHTKDGEVNEIHFLNKSSFSGANLIMHEKSQHCCFFSHSDRNVHFLNLYFFLDDSSSLFPADFAWLEEDYFVVIRDRNIEFLLKSVNSRASSGFGRIKRLSESTNLDKVTYGDTIPNTRNRVVTSSVPRRAGGRVTSL